MTVLIVGADSGIGKALCEAIPGSLGTSRRNETSHLYMDVMDSNTYPDISADMVYYCIGASGSRPAEEILAVNAIKSYQFLEHIAKRMNDGGTIRVLSSVAGSLDITNRMSMKLVSPYYKMSKAALNMGVIKLHSDFPNINWQLLHPGIVRTKMTEHMVFTDSKYQFITPEESAEKILNTPIIPGLSFINVVSGHTIPW